MTRVTVEPGGFTIALNMSLTTSMNGSTGMAVKVVRHHCELVLLQ